MRIALCLGGQIRTAEKCAPSLYRYIYQPLINEGATVDTFVHTQTTDIDIQGVYKAFQPMRCLMEDDRPLDMSFMSEDSIEWHKVGTLSERYRCLNSVRNGCMPHAHPLYVWQYMDSFSVKYDWIIFTRPDALFWPIPIESVSSLTSHADVDTLFLSAHDNWWGYSNRFFMGTPAAMRLSMCQIEYAKEYCQTHKFHSETFFKWLMDTKAPTTRIQRTRVVCNLARMDGTIWEAEWQTKKGEGDVLEFRDPKIATTNHMMCEVARLSHLHI